MIIENIGKEKQAPNAANADQRSALAMVWGNSFQAFFYKHVTTYRGLKYHKAEQFNNKLIMKMLLQTVTRFVKNYWW